MTTRIALATTMMTLAITAAPLRAQNPAPAVPAGNDAQAVAADGLDEIVVTAEKRPSVEQRTAIAMTVATGAQLTAAGVTDVNQISNIAPTLNIAQNNANTLITIRGVSSRDYTETGDPAVAVSIDGFYLQRALGLNAGLFDIDHLEVLRGPQGTLYGRNATAGALNILTAKPTDHFSFDGSAETGNYGKMNLEAAINVPLTDTLAIRVSGAVRKREGYRHNDPEPRGDDTSSDGARLHIQWKPTDRLSVLLTGEYVRDGGVGSVIQGVPYADVKADGTLDFRDDRRFALNNRGYTHIDKKAGRWNFAYDLGPLTASYTGGYQYMTFHRDNDQDGGTAFNYGFQQNEDISTQNHELRLTTNGTGPFTAQAGLYYFREADSLLTYFQVHGLAVDPFNFYTFDYGVKSESKAAFAQIGYNITDQIKVEGGIRYTEDRKSQVGTNDIAGTHSILDNHYKGHKVTYHGAVNWQATSQNLLYAKFDTGYKAGGYTTDAAFGPESITAYEIGSKNRFFGNQLQINLSAFYYDYRDLQVQQNDPATAISRVVNAGKAKDYGGELEGVWRVTSDDRIDLNVAYLHARFKDLVAAVNGVNTQLAGNRLPQAPTWSLGGGLQHDFHLANATITARAQSRYQSKSFFTILNRATEQQTGYTKTDVSLTYTPVDSHWSLSVYARNLEDSRILTDSEEAGYAGGYLVQYAEPRTYGGRIAFNF